MESIQSETNVVLGKENCTDPKAECRGSAEILKPGLSKDSITSLMVAPHSTTIVLISLVSSSFYLSFLITV